MSFWAIELTPGKEFASSPAFDLHITQAVLPEGAKDTTQRSVIQCAVDGKTFSVASLRLDNADSVPLDLVFEEGSNVTFTVSGKNPVHLVGYFIAGANDDEFDDDDLGEFDEDELDVEDEDEEDADEEEADAATQLALQNNLKRKQQQGNANGSAAKKAKQEAAPKQPQQPQQPQQPPQGQQAQQGQGQQQKKQQQQGGNKGQQQGQQGQQQQGGKKPQASPQQQPQQQGQDYQQLQGGLKYLTLTPGTGEKVLQKSLVWVNYVGRLTNGKVFDKSPKGVPFSFRIGGGEVIKGWDAGVNGMKVGEKRKLVIPPAMAYGARGAPPEIPPNATLEFDVEVVKVGRK